MKTLLIIFSTFLFSFTTINSEIATTSAFVEDQLIFDGYEGNYYFFTDPDFKAVVLEVNDASSISNYDLVNGNFEGKTFQVSYKTTDNPQNASAIGVIQDIKATK